MKIFFRYILIVLLISFSICCKKKEVRILGSWKYVYLSSNDNHKVQTWTFYEDNSLVRTLTCDTLVWDTLKPDTGTWSINKKIFNGNRLVISNTDNHFDGKPVGINGTYSILTLNKKYFIIQRSLFSDGTSSGAFLRAEFVKN